MAAAERKTETERDEEGDKEKERERKGVYRRGWGVSQRERGSGGQ